MQRRVSYILGLMLACWLLPAPAEAMPREVILMRHGDKDTSRGDSNLSPEGFLRSVNLGRLLPACFGPIDRIGTFEFAFDTQKNARSYQTAVPLAVATGLQIRVFRGVIENTQLAGSLMREEPWAADQRLVLFWEHQRLPGLERALGWEGMQPIDDADFDNLYLLRFNPGEALPQVEQLSQKQLFQRPCFRDAVSPLPVVPLP
jgi:hypothetical protein